MGLISDTGDERGVMLVTVNTVILALAVTSVTLRMWSLHLKKRPLDINDYLILFALLCSIAMVAMVVLAVIEGGLGRHTVSLIQEPQSFVLFGKIFVAIQPFWVSAVTAVKISILDLYIHVFGSNKTLRKFCFTGMMICVLFWIYDILAAFLICRPLAYNWNRTIPGGHCGNEVAAFIAAHSISSAIDIYLAILPLPVLWGLQMPTKKKIEISIMFSLGTLICIISLLKIAYWRIITGTDLTYTATVIYLCATLEPLLGIVLASLPKMRPVGIQITNSSVSSWTKSLLRSLGNGSTRPDSRLTSKNPKPESHNFERLNEDSNIKVVTTLHTDVESYPMKHR